MARTWDIAPSEFWKMTISEILTEYEMRRPTDDSDYAGKLTRGDVEELQEWMEG